MFKIDALTGSALMRLWGVPSWPTVEGDYWLWHGIAILVVIDRGPYVELHMAMKQGERHRCRDAVSDVLDVIGKREIRALIRIEHRQVCNLARKFNFEYDCTLIMEFLDGTIGEVIQMIRRAK